MKGRHLHIGFLIMVLAVLALSSCESTQRVVEVDTGTGSVVEGTQICDPDTGICYEPDEGLDEEPQETPEEDVEEEVPEEEPEEVPEEDVEEETPEMPDQETIDLEIDGKVVTLPVITVTETETVAMVPGENIPAAVSPDGLSVEYDFSDPLNDEGEWVTEVGDAGEYVVTVTATSGGQSAEKKFYIIVKSLNQAPVLAKIADRTVEEGDTVVIGLIAVDPDGDDIEYSATGLPAGAELDGTEFMWTPGLNTVSAGQKTFTVTFEVSDGKASSVQKADITVKNKNRAPEISEVTVEEVVEGDTATIEVDADDPDGDELTITFGDPFNAAGEWDTEVGDAGEYEVKVTATDGKAKDEVTVTVTVLPKNKAPVFESIPDQEVDEGDTLEFEVTAIDPDGDDVTITAKDLPDGADFDDGVFTWTPDYDVVDPEDGTEEVTVRFVASDGKTSKSKDIIIQVTNVNRPPVWFG